MFPAWLLLLLSRAKGLRTCLSSRPSAGARPLGPIKCVYLKPHADSNLATRLNHFANVIICQRERRVIFDAGQVLWLARAFFVFFLQRTVFEISRGRYVILSLLHQGTAKIVNQAS